MTMFAYVAHLPMAQFHFTLSRRRNCNFLHVYRLLGGGAFHQLKFLLDMESPMITKSASALLRGFFNNWNISSLKQSQHSWCKLGMSCCFEARVLYHRSHEFCHGKCGHMVSIWSFLSHGRYRAGKYSSPEAHFSSPFGSWVSQARGKVVWLVRLAPDQVPYEAESALAPAQEWLGNGALKYETSVSVKLQGN